MSTDTTEAAVAQLIENGPRIFSAVDDLLEQGVRSSSETEKALNTLDEAMRMAREHPEVRERLRFLFVVLAGHTHVAGPLAPRLAQLKTDAAAFTAGGDPHV